MAEGFKPSEAELRAWLVKTCEERYPYRNGETYHENWRPTDDTCRPVSYGVLRALLAIMAARESERDEAEKVVCDLLWWAEQKCPCENEEPNPCTLCGAPGAQARRRPQMNVKTPSSMPPSFQPK